MNAVCAERYHIVKTGVISQHLSIPNGWSSHSVVINYPLGMIFSKKSMTILSDEMLGKVLGNSGGNVLTLQRVTVRGVFPSS